MAPRGTSAVASIPAHHPYVEQIRPRTVRPALGDRTVSWEPDPLFDLAYLRANRAAIDLVHLHFGFDHRTTDELAAWVAELGALRLPLVHTVHDLRNPHHETRARHDAHLRLLTDAAAALTTLTDSAAAEYEQRFGRRPEVVAHPTLLDPLAELPTRDVAGAPVVLLPLKAVRCNVRDAGLIARTAHEAAVAAGAQLQVLINPDAVERAQLPDPPPAGLLVDRRGHLPEQDLLRLVTDAAVVVLPYRFGTHSGFLELCRDLGTRVVAPTCGHYAGQWSDVVSYRNDERSGLDAASLRAALAEALASPPPAPASRAVRLAELETVRSRHAAIYRAARYP